MKGRDMKYFTDDDDEKKVREYRKNKEAYEFSLESRHMALLVVVGLIVAVLVFSVGYITGKSQALKGIETAGLPAGDTALVPTPAGDTVAEGEGPAVNFYDTLGEGEVPTDEMDSYTPPGGGTAPETPKPPTDVATGPKTGDTDKTALFFIQMITTKDKKKAVDLVTSLKSEGYPAYSKDLADGTTRVGIKWYKTKEEAQKTLKEIVAKDKYKNYKPEIGTGWP
jgi:hypothetical protein